MTARSDRFSGGGTWRERAGRLISSRGIEDQEYGQTLGLTGIGAALSEARTTREISYATAEHETHIPRHHLQALEEERFSAFSAPVYVRGFLRSYSQYLGLDSSELLAMLPPDSPAEDERLLPLSRLGRPRGPREAARARHDPTERDAAPLTESHARRAPARALAAESDPPNSGRMRFAIDRGPGHPARPPARLDPLGRLGWPEVPGERRDTDGGGDAESSSVPEGSEARAQFTKESWERPLAPHRSRRWGSERRWRGVVPEDVRPLFTRTPLLAVGMALIAVLTLVASSIFLGGGDGSPDVFAAASSGGGGGIATGGSQGPAVAHGPMPDVRGSDLNNALTTLKTVGVVPVVIRETNGDDSVLRVTAQLPSAGSALRPQIPVVLVLGSTR